MAINWKNVFSFGGGVVAHEIAENALNHILGQVSKQGADFIKGNILGLGTDDEVLFNSALSYAVFGPRNVAIVDLMKVINVFASLGRASNRRVIQVIGKDEREVVMKIPSIDPLSNTVRTGKKGEVLYDEIKTVANVRGAETIALMSKMNEADIKIYIETSNMTSPMGDKLAEMLEPANLKAAVMNVKSGYDQIGDQLCSGNTKLDQWARKFRK